MSVFESAVQQSPSVAPQRAVQAVKGRLQRLVKKTESHPFRRNFSFDTVGDPSRKVVENYIETQLKHHKLSDERANEALKKFQLKFDNDLSIPQLSSHGRYRCNLHLCLVHEGRWANVNEDQLEITKNAILETAESEQIRLSVVSICADHFHAAMGCHYSKSPEEIALAFLNRLAAAHKMDALFQHSYYVGTFGEYDMGAIRHNLS